jgi:hypothetical protein
MGLLDDMAEGFGEIAGLGLQLLRLQLWWVLVKRLLGLQSQRAALQSKKLKNF